MVFSGADSKKSVSVSLSPHGGGKRPSRKKSKRIVVFQLSLHLEHSFRYWGGFENFELSQNKICLGEFISLLSSLFGNFHTSNTELIMHFIATAKVNSVYSQFYHTGVRFTSSFMPDAPNTKLILLSFHRDHLDGKIYSFGFVYVFIAESIY